MKEPMIRLTIAALLLSSAPGFAQGQKNPAPKSYQTQSPASFSFAATNNGQTIDITNVAYDVTGKIIPGRPQDDRLILRETVHRKIAVDEIGEEATTTIEAWPLGVDFRQKPTYTLKVAGVEPTVVEGEVLQVTRGVEEVDWWSVYKLATAEHLFDTYVPLKKFSISRETLTLRYVGLEVPPDDTPDKRLKEPHVVGVLTYASATKVIRELLITCDDLKQAPLLRSFADAERTLDTVEQNDALVHSLRITFRQSFPSAPNPVVLTIPLAADDLDAAHAQLPPHLHVAVWKR